MSSLRQTDEIFENVHNNVNKKADKNEQTLRISIDTKAKVNVGEFSRKGEHSLILDKNKNLVLGEE